MAPHRLGVLAGLRVEARCLAGLEAEVAYSGADPERARAAARRLLETGCTGLVSFGLAAGLAPDLGPGDLVLAEGVILPDGRHVATDPVWRARLSDALGRGDMAPLPGAVAGSDSLLTTPAAKRALFAATGALAADMESHAVAEAAAARGVPFIALRAIGDPAGQALPGSATAFVTAEGAVRPALVAGLLARPFELAALLRVGLQSRRALRILRRAAGLAAPGLGLG